MDIESYRKNLIALYESPLNYGVLDQYSISYEADSPLCGDHIEVYLSIENQHLSAIKWTGDGCAVCSASASLLTEYSKGRAIAEILQLTEGDVTELLGIKLPRTRVKCALLPLRAIQEGINAIPKEEIDRMNWEKVIEMAELKPNRPITHDFEYETALIVLVDDVVYAIEDRCTHDDAPLEGGVIMGCQIACPRHGAKFDLKTGEALTMPARSSVPCYPTKIEDGVLYIQVPEE